MHSSCGPGFTFQDSQGFFRPWRTLVIRCHAGDAKFSLSAPRRLGRTLVPALQLMRMISRCCKRPDFPLRSGNVLRCVHLLRQVLAACPATPRVGSPTRLRLLPHLLTRCRTAPTACALHEHTAQLLVSR